MTLPFRRRHHDHEVSHDRARAIVATGFLEPTEPTDEAWLETHLAGCGECRAEIDGYRADRELLRGLRDQVHEPPRDLWARTAASIEREAGRRDPAARTPGRLPRLGGFPLGVLSGALVVLVVVATSLVPRSGPRSIGPTGPARSDLAVATPAPEATPLAVTARSVTWIQAGDDGTFDLVFAVVDTVCTAGPDACAPLDDASSTRLTLSSEPQSVVISPDSEQIVVVPAATGAGSGDVLVVPVPTAAPSPDPSASVVPETAPPSPSATPEPTPTLGPGETAGPTASPDPNEPHAILTGVVVVGEVAYSADGTWLAFSARPIDGSAGPDLYLWRVGDPDASAVTADHQTFFAGWLGNRVLASRIVVAEVPAPLESIGPAASAAASAELAEDRAVSFLMDPETATATDLAGADIWSPVVDPTARTIVFWSGTLVPDGTGTGWTLGSGRLVMDGWLDPSADLDASPDPGAPGDATPGPSGAIDPQLFPTPPPPPGPAGRPIVLAEGPLAAFETSFDPTGTRLAVWVAVPGSADVGTLRLVGLDVDTGLIAEDVDPLPGVTALRGFSIGTGRLAWVTPPGQDGNTSHLNVLAWTGDEFGQASGIAKERLLVVR